MLSSAFDSLDLGAYTNAAAASVGGILLAASNVACLVLAIGFSVPRIRSHRPAFWIPVVCAAVALLATGAIVIGLLASDPAWLARFSMRG